MDHIAYDKCLKEMFGLRRFGIKLGLDIIGHMMDGLGNPQHHFSCIHVAGTNGKGSIASVLSAILQAAGYRVGLYTSPHLVRFNERICINNEPISDAGVVEAYEAVKLIYHGDREPTFFEYNTAMALYAFGKAGVDFAVIETGMGGRLDATNIISPALSIISNISMEHRSYLGGSIAEIAGEKGGIIKANTPVITGVKQKAAMEKLKHIAGEKSAPLYRLGEHFRIRRHRTDGIVDRFSYYGMDHTWKNMQSALPGAHQADNAGVVLGACEVLMRQKAALTDESIRTGMANVCWPGRLEIVPMRPEIVIDGAHNLMAARRLGDFLSEYTADRSLTLVIGILDDKPYPAMLRALVPIADRVIFTRPVIERSLPAATLLAEAGPMAGAAEAIDAVDRAVYRAIGTTAPQDLVCIAGSLYVVGEAKQALEAMDVIHTDSAPAAG
ncbi:MAG: bifunctional folylpolyglutamate synthase/dihydrofolate synthase [Thermodesulfobacteriota bacterium]